MTEPSAAAGAAELRAALDALQTSLENLDAELYPGLDSWSDEARAAHAAAVREWADAAQHMSSIVTALEDHDGSA